MFHNERLRLILPATDIIYKTHGCPAKLPDSLVSYKYLVCKKQTFSQLHHSIHNVHDTLAKLVRLVHGMGFRVNADYRLSV